MVSDKNVDAAAVRQSFWSVLNDGSTKILNEAPVVWKGPDADKYQYERAMISDNCKPLLWGVFYAVLSFGSFRLVASRWFQQYRQKRLMLSPQNQTKQWKPQLDHQHDQRGEQLSDAFSVLTDLMLSLLIGTSGALFVVNQPKLRKDFERAPTLAGRSLISEHMCKPMITAYEQASPEVWQQQDTTLEMMCKFVDNCRKRAEVEQAIRQHQHLDPDEPVSIRVDQCQWK